LNQIFSSFLHKGALNYSHHAASVMGGHEYGAMVERQKEVTGNKVSTSTSAPQMELDRQQPETYSLNRVGKKLID